MSDIKGLMRTCDRCGAWVFMKCVGEGSADGGYTRWNNFEPVSGWDYIKDVGTVCPKCWDEYTRFLNKFKQKPPKVKGESNE